MSYIEDEEIWKPIKGFEDVYEVSNCGNVRSLDRVFECSNQFGTCKKFFKGGLLKQKIDKYGYPCLMLSYKGQKFCFTVHVLVARTFIGDYDSTKYNVNHIDGNKKNNHISNLEIITIRENVLHALDNDINKCYGENHPLSRLKNSEIEDIYKLYSTGLYSRPELGEMFNINTVNIARIVNGEARYCKQHNMPAIKLKKIKRRKTALSYEEAQQLRKEYYLTRCSYASLGRKYNIHPTLVTYILKHDGYARNIIDRE